MVDGRLYSNSEGCSKQTGSCVASTLLSSVDEELSELTTGGVFDVDKGDVGVRVGVAVLVGL